MTFTSINDPHVNANTHQRCFRRVPTGASIHYSRRSSTAADCALLRPYELPYFTVILFLIRHRVVYKRVPRAVRVRDPNLGPLLERYGRPTTLRISAFTAKCRVGTEKQVALFLFDPWLSSERTNCHGGLLTAEEVPGWWRCRDVTRDEGAV